MVRQFVRCGEPLVPARERGADQHHRDALAVSAQTADRLAGGPGENVEPEVLLRQVGYVVPGLTGSPARRS